MNNIDITDEALRIVYLERSKELEDVKGEHELNFILSASYPSVMDEPKKNRLLEHLMDIAFSMSFGELLAKKMAQQSMNKEGLAQQAKLPHSIVNDLLADNIYTNNVPIIILKNLLNTLQINFSAAENGIRKTFEILQNRISSTELLGAQKPAYRKGLFISKEAFSNPQGKNEGKELYENKEALEKYLHRLDELLK
jgi:hypothetical protein